MVAVGSRCIHMMIGMMHQMHHPKRFKSVFGQVRQISPNKIKKQHAQKHIEPKRKGNKVQQTKLVGVDPISGSEQQKRQTKIYQYGGYGKKEIGQGMLPLFIG